MEAATYARTPHRHFHARLSGRVSKCVPNGSNGARADNSPLGTPPKVALLIHSTTTNLYPSLSHLTHKMPYLKTSTEWFEQSSLLLKARPTSVRRPSSAPRTRPAR
jgi:hypothetical protein